MWLNTGHKPVKLTQWFKAQVLQSLDLWQKMGQYPAPASVGMAEIDDAKATTTARKETCIV
jgi:oxalate decarboxylase/phosphoglucose isomerase-like protein (cupin superfamily)